VLLSGRSRCSFIHTPRRRSELSAGLEAAEAAEAEEEKKEKENPARRSPRSAAAGYGGRGAKRGAEYGGPGADPSALPVTDALARISSAQMFCCVSPRAETKSHAHRDV